MRPVRSHLHVVGLGNWYRYPNINILGYYYLESEANRFLLILLFAKRYQAKNYATYSSV